jgi:hypothetical protein
VTPITLIVAPEPDHSGLYDIRWSNGSLVAKNIQESFLDLSGFLAARGLIQLGYDPDRLLIVRLEGSDTDLMRAPLGVAAAKPTLGVVQ